MIDNAPAASSSSEEASSEETKALKLAQEQLTLENKELHDMMEEFGNMWTADSKQFHEALVEAKEAKLRADKEIEKLLAIRTDNEETIKELHITVLGKRNIEEALKEAVKTNNELQKKLSDAESERKCHDEHIRQVMLMKDATNAQLLERQDFLNQQATELKTALDELFESRETTAQKLETLNVKWMMERQSYEVKIANMEADQNTVNLNHNKAQMEWTKQMEALNSQIDDITHSHNQFRQQLEIALRQATGERAFYQHESIRLIEENQRLQGEVENLSSTNLSEKEEHDTIVDHMQATINSLQENAAATEQRLAKTLEELDLVQAKLLDSDDNCRESCAELASMTEKRDVTLAELRNVRMQLYNAQCDATIQKQQMMVENKRVADEVCQNFNDHLKSINEQHAATCEELRNQIKKLGQEKDQILNKFHSIQNENMKMKGAYKECCRDIEGLKTEVAEANAQFLFEAKEHKALKKTVTELQEIRSTEHSAFDFQMKKWREVLTRQEEEHKTEIAKLKEQHKELVDNMGIETFDEEAQEEMVPKAVEAVEETNEDKSAEWELVDEE